MVWRGQSAIHECARAERENEFDARGKEYAPLVSGNWRFNPRDVIFCDLFFLNFIVNPFMSAVRGRKSINNSVSSGGFSSPHLAIERARIPCLSLANL